ncbi:hypothetical protein [Marinifilum caeruleilacunae]|uniref:Toxin-antitoxin system YwqK family antitoxin n=1 Tax=Marinifilum caeruleilacunae TaxID=2499076 RepID=A0ABX1WUC0_9BACT|nr:hypothetical protein [Marinifilum caeruleilacunae]NOU59602.1 hypothetical protein [Marinifilum caeruleilacunae]
MKKLLIMLTILFVQKATAQIEVELFFYDTCADTIAQVQFDLFDIEKNKTFYSKNNKVIVDTIGKYLVGGYLTPGDLSYYFTSILHIKKKDKLIDTLNVSTIRFVTERALHSSFWNYYKCDKPCEGYETDYYSNGAKRVEGYFNSGKPDYISQYREDGTLETKTFYLKGMNLQRRVEYYDQAGELFEYETWDNRERKTIIKTYDSNGKFLNKEIIR